MNATAATTHWQPLAPGLAYTEISFPSDFPIGHIYAFRFNLQRYKLTLALAEDHHRRATSVKNLVIQNNALIGTNGGFFTPYLKPLGLRIDNGKVRNPLKHITWWGVFLVENGHAKIVSQKSYRLNKKVEFAIQGGPRLIINDRIPTLKPGIANRTALGITSTGQVILLATHNLPLTTTQLAQIMRRPASQGGLGCVNALNLDGGSSTQLFAKVDRFVLDVPGFSTVTDAVLVAPRK